MAFYNNFKGLALKAGNVDFENDDIYVALFTSSYTPNIDTDIYFDDLANEVSDDGYTAGGQIVTNPTVTVDTTDNEAVFDADDVTWTSSTITARYAVVYKNTGNVATSPVICYIDFGEDKSSSAGDFKIVWNAEGIINLG